MKIIKSVLAVAFLSLFITSCLNFTQTTTLKTDGSGSMFIHYWTKWKTAKDSLVLENLGIFNKEEIAKEFTSKYNKIKDVEIYWDYSDTTAHAKIEFEFANIDSLNNMKVFKESKFSFKTGATENTKIFSQFIPPFATGFGIDRKKYSITYIYYIPGDVLEHNANELSNNKLTWKFSLDDIGTGKFINVTFRPFKLKETPVCIFALAFSVLSVVFVFLFKKKKK